jgi:L-arabinose transport system ATP-binding protein
MSVADNIFLGHLPNRLCWLDKRELRRAASEQLAALEEDIDPSAKAGSLPMAQRQMIEIAKSLVRDAKVIAFDEPTSSLSDREVRKLFSVIGDLRRAGRVIIYVSHRMAEIFEVCDSATVFRDGEVVAEFDDLRETRPDEVVSRMVGRSIEDIYGYQSRTIGAPALGVAGLIGPGLTAPVDLTVGQGEIVCLFGLVGAGRSELLRAIYGATRATHGQVLVRGEAARIASPTAALRHGIALCPEDRKREGIVPQRSVRENINLSARRRLAPYGWLRPQEETRNAEEHVRDLDIRAASLAQLAGQLSGGNQQKVLLGRSMSQDIKVLLLDEPTRGIDVGAKSEMYRIITRLAGSGIGMLIASSELPEVLGIADRVIVMRGGRIVASVPRGEATEVGLLRMALPVAATDDREDL